MVTSFVISYSFVPAGTFTSTVSPSSWLRRHLPIGEEGEIRPIVGSDSSGVTISKTVSSPVPVSRTLTVDPRPTLPFGILSRLTMESAASRRWIWPMRAWRKLWRSLAALYSAFSRKSPCSRALRISLGRWTFSS